MNNQDIEKTNSFKELDSVTQLIYKKKKMMDQVKNELEIAKQIGFEKYKKIYHPGPYKTNVINELLKQ